VPSIYGLFAWEADDDNVIVRMFTRKYRDQFSPKGNLGTPRLQRGGYLFAVFSPFFSVFDSDVSDQISGAHLIIS
jgi:hypothetical protein